MKRLAAASLRWLLAQTGGRVGRIAAGARAAMAELPLETYPSLDAFTAAAADCRELWDARYRAEQALGPASAALRPLMWCTVCQQITQLELRGGEASAADWREQGSCSNCGLNCRVRLGFALLDRALAQLDGPLYLTEQTTPAYVQARRRYAAVVGSEYVLEAARREQLQAFLDDQFAGKQRLQHEDLTALSFADRRFAAIACFEVLEHVPDYRRAIAELHRVLRPGGSLILSVPFLHFSPATLVRARFEGDQLVHLLPAEYHGDPVGEQGVLCFYHFGWDLLDALREAGFAHVEYVRAWSATHGVLGQSGLIRARR